MSACAVGAQGVRRPQAGPQNAWFVGLFPDAQNQQAKFAEIRGLFSVALTHAEFVDVWLAWLTRSEFLSTTSCADPSPSALAPRFACLAIGWRFIESKNASLP